MTQGGTGWRDDDFLTCLSLLSECVAAAARRITSDACSFIFFPHPFIVALKLSIVRATAPRRGSGRRADG